MQLSGAVVLRGGKTEGVLWETARAREYVPPERLLIMLPGTNPEEPGYAHSEKEPARLEERYREFRELVQGNFPKGLPERSDGAGFVCFDVDWNPRLIGRTRTETRERPRRGAFVLGVCSFGVAWAYVFGAAFSKGDVDLKLLLGLLLVPSSRHSGGDGLIRHSSACRPSAFLSGGLWSSHHFSS